MDSEVLEHEPDSWRPGRSTRIVAVLVLMLVALAVLADRDVRSAEAAALSKCSQEVDAAVDASFAPVDSMVAYVRPTRDGASTPLSRELDAMVAEKTASAPSYLDSARSTCMGVAVLSHHTSLEERKRACLARLEGAREYFATVASNGAAAFQPNAFDRRKNC